MWPAVAPSTRSIDFCVHGMLINISLIIRAFVECVRFEWAIYLIKRSVVIRYDSPETRECGVRQAWQIENEVFFFIKCDKAEILSSFPVSIYAHLKSYFSDAAQPRIDRTISAFYREIIFLFLVVDRYRWFRKNKKFIVSFFIDLVFSDWPLWQLGWYERKIYFVK